ncbi:MAG: MYXO-CTERM sorting domain-containing protein [Myxococcales bacterium]|nr:MYXO-CTERM sorting domain-containing protein [Myxococcales bacterium]
MPRRAPRSILALTTTGPLCAAILLTAAPGAARAEGEEVDGHPSWAERVHLQLTNRARCDPQVEMAQCGNNCADAACYSPKQPLYHKHEASRAARFHAANMSSMNFFAHTSACTLADTVPSEYPDTCGGEAACACVGGMAGCSPTCTSAQSRVGMFGAGYFGEIIAGGSSPNQAFYLWLYEPTADPACMFTGENGHRWLLLTAGSAVGFGVDGYHVGDFSSGGTGYKIPSGSHWPRQSSSVEAWASWYDDQPPNTALINVDGTCTPMSLERGVAENGAYTATVTGVGQGCHRYYFVFEDSGGETVFYPETGSLGIGAQGACADWTPERPELGAGCNCDPSCGAAVCGDDGCGGSCGSCAGNEACVAGVCECQPACDGLQCGDDGCGGECGTCPDGQFCSAGQCSAVDPTDPTTDPIDPTADPTDPTDPTADPTDPTADPTGPTSGGASDGCVPECAGLMCGDDGCGGVCGTCESGSTCIQGQCELGETDSGALPPGYGDTDAAADGCGCASDSPAPSGGWLGALLMLGALGRRRRAP